MLKKLYRWIMFYLTVPKCVCCGEALDYSDRCFCPSCLTSYEDWKKRNCSRCGKLLSSCVCSNKYLISHGIRKVVKVYRYRNSDKTTPNNCIIYALKQSNRADVFDFLADELASAIRNSITINSDRFIVTNVPRRPVSIQKYGYDHSAVLAKRIAKRLKLDYVSVLKSKARKAQKDTTPDERFTNVSISAKRKQGTDIRGKTAIIVDDIVTTGASMSAAGRILRELGVKHTVGAAVAIAYKDMDEKRI